MAEVEVTQTEQVEIPEVMESSLFREAATIVGHNQAITDLQVSEDGKVLASASRDRTALVWDVKATQECWATQKTRLEGHNHVVSAVSLSSDATHLLTSSWDKTIRLWSLEKRESISLFKGHTKDVLDVVFSPDNRRVFTAGRDNTVRLWTINGELRHTINGDSWATSISCAYDAKNGNDLIVAIGYWNGALKVLKVSKEITEVFVAPKAHNGRLLDVAIDPEGLRVVTGGSDRKVNVFDIETGNVILSINAPGVVNAVSICPTRTWICAATYNGVAVYDIAAGAQQIDLVSPKFEHQGKREAGRFPDCTAIAWSHDSSVMYTGYNNGEIYVWQAK